MASRWCQRMAGSRWISSELKPGFQKGKYQQTCFLEKNIWNDNMGWMWENISCKFKKVSNAKHVFNSSSKHENALFCLPSSFQRSFVISFLSRQRRKRPLFFFLFISFPFRLVAVSAEESDPLPSRHIAITKRRKMMNGQNWDWLGFWNKKKKLELARLQLSHGKRGVCVAAAKCCSDWGRERLGI